MSIIIAGAGRMGQHIASVLSKEQYNVVVVDKEKHPLQQISTSLDIATHQGDSTDWKLLDDLREFNPKLLIALTNQDETNFTTCSIAKHMGFPATVARIRKPFYLPPSPVDIGRIFFINYFISPEILVAENLFKAIMSPGSYACESFADGSVQMRTIPLPTNWKLSKIPLKDFSLPPGVMIGLIRRKSHSEQHGTPSGYHQVILPHGEDFLLPKDEVTFIGKRDVVAQIENYLNIPSPLAHSIVILGGSLSGEYLAQLLSKHKIHVRLIEPSHEKCLHLAERLPHITVIHHSYTDPDFLRDEQINRADVIVCCSADDESNILSAMIAKELKCSRIMSIISNPKHATITENLELSHTVSPLKVASKKILPLVRGKSIRSMTSLYDDQIEVLEIQIAPHCRLIGEPLAQLGPKLPKDFLLAAILNRGKVLIADGNRVLSPGDTLIAITHVQHVPYLNQIFN